MNTALRIYYIKKNIYLGQQRKRLSHYYTHYLPIRSEATTSTDLFVCPFGWLAERLSPFGAHAFHTHRLIFCLANYFYTPLKMDDSPFHAWIDFYCCAVEILVFAPVLIKNIQ